LLSGVSEKQVDGKGKRSKGDAAMNGGDYEVTGIDTQDNVAKQISSG
jgi:hypothetical protein